LNEELQKQRDTLIIKKRDLELLETSNSLVKGAKYEHQISELNF